jgi:heme a synthase
MAVSGILGRQLGPTGVRGEILRASLLYGFGTAIAVWVAWFVTHLPWLGVDERTSVPLLLGVWFAGMVLAGRGLPRGMGWLGGVGAGKVTALVGLLALGTKLAEAPAGAADAAAGMKPDAALIVLGFIALGATLGLAGGTIGNLVRPSSQEERPLWLARFAILASVAVMPLLFVGGLVTSTNSGMAVPDWPGTFGSNMFLYPLGPRARPDVYLEHSHRLFGTLVGLMTLVLMVWVMLAEPRRWLKVLVAVAFALVVVQGVIGGIRVTMDSRLLAAFHGVLAQLVFGVFVAIAVFLSPTWRGARQLAAESADPPALQRRAKFFCTGVLHATIMQLILGAMYRHFGGAHALWTHAGFAFVVLVIAAAAGFTAGALRGEYGGIGPALRRAGTALLIVVCVQFALGWAAFLSIGDGSDESTARVLIRTAHQANGALLLAMAVVAMLWSKRLARLNRLRTA